MLTKSTTYITFLTGGIVRILLKVGSEGGQKPQVKSRSEAPVELWVKIIRSEKQ